MRLGCGACYKKKLEHTGDAFYPELDKTSKRANAESCICYTIRSPVKVVCAQNRVEKLYETLQDKSISTAKLKLTCETLKP